MALSAGTRLGPYEILAPLGAGGMGEVYRATDRTGEVSFRSERPVPWSDVHYQNLGTTVSSFALHPDGEQVALRLGEDESGATADSVVIVTNFFDELRRLTAEGGE